MDGALAAVVPRLEMRYGRHAQSHEGSAGLARGHLGGEADVVAPVVEHGDTFQQQSVGTFGQERYAVLVGVEVEALELVDVLDTLVDRADRIAGRGRR